MCWVSLLPLPGFSLGLNTGLWTPVKHKHTHTNRSPRGVEVSAVYQAHATPLDLSVCGGDKCGVWVGDGFVFPVEGKAQFYTERVCSGCSRQMRTIRWRARVFVCVFERRLCRLRRCFPSEFVLARGEAAFRPCDTC